MICCIDYLQLYSTTATDKLVSANVNTTNAIAAWWHLANLAEADAVVVVVVVSGDKVIISVPFTVTGGHLPGTALASATSKPQHSVSSTLSLSSQSTQSLYCWCCLETYEAVNIKCITKQQPLLRSPRRDMQEKKSYLVATTRLLFLAYNKISGISCARDSISCAGDISRAHEISRGHEIRFFSCMSLRGLRTIVCI